MASTTSTNDSSSVNLLDFETFSDVVGEIPEVDCRGKVNRSFTFSSDLDSVISKTSKDTEDDQTSPKSERNANFLKSLLTPRSPYQEFHRLFKTVPEDQFPINAFSCALSREILLQGRMYVSQGWFCFYSNIFGWENQVTIDCNKIKTITRQKTAYVVPNAILICVGDEKYFFSSFLQRETVYKLLYRIWIESRRRAGLEDDKSEEGLVDPDNNNFSNDGSLEELMVCEQSLEQPSNSDGSDGDDGDSSPSCPICGFIGGEIPDSACAECGILPGPGEFQLMDIPDLLNEEERPHLSDSLLCTEQISPCVQEQRKLRLPSYGGAIMLASFSDFISSWKKTLLKYFRLSRNDLFVVMVSFLVVILFLMSAFLMYRISVLEPRILHHYHGRLPGYSSAKQMWVFREELFQAQIMRFRNALDANVDAVTQVRNTLHILQEDLGERLTNCSPFNSSQSAMTK